MGSVQVNPVDGIHLPNRGGPTNPVASDTQSQLPPPLAPKKPAKPLVKPPDVKAIELPGKKATKKPSWWIADQPDKFHAKQKNADNQLTSSAGQRLSDPRIDMPGAGQLGLGSTASVFGSQFGAYADLLRNLVARAWRTGDIDPRVRTAPQVIVTFTLYRDGHVSNVHVTQSSGISALDYSGQRAILDVKFPPLPPGFPKSEIDIDFVFELKR
jgi:TonB family protein